MEKKVMSDYSLYCTEEQTRKALELGAPIIQTHANPSIAFVDRYPMCIWVSTDDKYVDKGYVLAIPTAEQMLGWLEEQGVWIHFCKPNQRPELLSYSISNIEKPFLRKVVGGEYKSRKETTLAAIDAALNYMKENKI